MGRILHYFFNSLGNMLDFSGSDEAPERLLLVRRIDERSRQSSLRGLADDFACIGRDIATASAKYADEHKLA